MYLIEKNNDNCVAEWFETFTEWFVRVGGDSLDLDTIEEQFDSAAIPDQRSRHVDVFIGRLQPPHKGHIEIIKKMKNPLVIIVRGNKSSNDGNRNPFNEQTQIRLLKKVFPKIQIVTAPHGYLPEIFSQLRESLGVEVRRLYAGNDRINGYKRQIDSINNKLSNNKKFVVDFHTTPRVASATKVREAIKNGDKAEFEKLMPRELWGEWDNLRSILVGDRNG